MEIKVVGSGCANCQTLEKNTSEALEEMGIQATVEKITDVNQFANYGVLVAPGLVVNGELKVFGRLSSKEEIKKWIQVEK